MADHLVLHFREYLRANLAQGQDGHGNTADYVSRPKLEAYWTAERVRNILDSYDPPLLEMERQITTSFILIFSVLVYIEKPRAITIFIRTNKDDHHLPFDSFGQEWPSSLPSSFLENQWMFCPLEFTSDRVWRRQLPTQQIMPVTFENSFREERRGQTTARVTKVRLHSDCSHLDTVVCILLHLKHEYLVL